MKKVFLLLTFLCALGFAADAQSCCANKAACAKADKAASTDANIEKRKADDGTVSFVRKEADAKGNVQFVSVKFDEASNAFVNVAPPATMSATDKAACTKKSATCSAAAGTEKKACCAGGAAAGKAACKSGEAKAAEQ